MAVPVEPHERKIQFTGGSTYTVSLPKDWAAATDIDAGTTVRLYCRGDRLLVTVPEAEEARRTVEVAASNRSPAELGRLVGGAYVTGAETIEIRGPFTDEQVRAVRDAVGGMVGLEITAESRGGIVATAMLDVGDLSSEQTLRQMKRMALSIQKQAVAAVLEGDAAAGSYLQRQDDDVDRLFALVSREFQRSLVDVNVGGAGTRLATFDYYATARQLERIADHAEKIARVAERIDEAPSGPVADRIDDLAGRSRDLVDRSVSATLGDDGIDALIAVVTDADPVVADAEALDRELYEGSIEDGYLLGTVVDSVIRTAEYGVNIAETGIQARLREPTPRPGERERE